MLCGIDLGSRNVKIAVMDKNKIIKTAVYDTIKFYKNYAIKKDQQLHIDFSALTIPNCQGIVSTGYGRLTVKLAGADAIPEIKAHYLGALSQCGLQNFTLLDLGGQDSKIVRVSGGKMVDFLTNDKCAASSGRYLENMATVLGIELGELSKYYERPVELSSTCAVFGETELIGKIVEGYSLEDLAAGVNYTIFKRIQPLLHKMGYDTLVFVGGVAKNMAFVEILKKELGSTVIIPPSPQFNGAIGCCVYGSNLEGLN
ncbi:MAG: 2-hydroxyglutaryl-CoA dehydratase [Desulfitibacter sp. BRH_c19]|nr:MAG: 2-hydroxyglutaryl-CoA dehydratase [Desulfitibacter sp. BRH_c19]